MNARWLACSMLLACNSPDAVIGAGAGSQGGAGGAGGGGGSGGGAALTALSPLWAHRYASAGDQRGAALDVSSGELHAAAALAGTITVDGSDITSMGNQDVLVLSLSTGDGSLASFIREGDGALQEVFALASSRQTEELALGGKYSGYLFNQQANGASNLWVARINADDTLRWIVRRINNSVRGTAFDSSNQIVSVGDFTMSLDTPDPDFVGAGGDDAFVFLLNQNGQMVAARQLGSPGDDSLTAVAVDTGGTLHAAGFAGGLLVEAPSEEHGGGKDVLIASFEADLTPRFVRLFGDAEDQRAEDVEIDQVTGDLLVVGWFEGTMTVGPQELTSRGGRDAFVLRLDDSGAPLFAASWGDETDQVATDVAIDGTGRIVVAGQFEGALELAGGKLVSAGKTDVFVLRLDDDGTPQAGQAFGDAESQYAEGLAIDDGDNVYLLCSVQGKVDFGQGPLDAIDTSFDLAIAKFAP